MPTAAKLIGAVLFTLIGWLAGGAYVATLPEGQPTTFLAPVCAVIGLTQGWFTMGRNVEPSAIVNLGTGLRASVQIVFFTIMFFGLLEMFDRSSRLRYDGPGEAVIASLELFMEYGLSILVATNSLIILGLGGIVAGVITGIVGAKWS